MSYDIRIGVKVDGTNIIAEIRTPEYGSPTYNLGEMFRECTGWNYNQSEWYKVTDVYDRICNGITELTQNPKWYKKYEPDNGFGTVASAVRALESLRKCIGETVDEIPIEHLWVRW